jgi:hypothetical protein
MLSEVLSAVQDDPDQAVWKTALNNVLVSRLIGVIRQCPFSPADYAAFKRLSLEDCQPAFRVYAEKARHWLQARTGSNPTVTILSVGCGSGHIEQFLNAIWATSKASPLSRIEWIGMDKVPCEAGSFFSQLGHRFVALSDDEARPYFDLARNSVLEALLGTPIMMAHFAYHHLDISLAEFLERCRGSAGIILLEELITERDWADWSYRAARIACDLLSNMGFNPAWAQQFMSDPTCFKVRYLFREDVQRLGGTLLDLEGCSPDLSVVLF